MTGNQKRKSSILSKLLPVIIIVIIYALSGGNLLEKLGLSPDQPEQASDSKEVELDEGAKVNLPQLDSEKEVLPKQEKEKRNDEERIYRAEEVAAYLREHGELPDGYLTKSEAYELGWKPEEGNLWEVAPGMSIGGDTFGNRERKLPRQKGRRYFEADVNYEGGTRGAKRVVYSNDGLIYYTDDHYESFVDVSESFDAVKR